MLVVGGTFGCGLGLVVGFGVFCVICRGCCGMLFCCDFGVDEIVWLLVV